MDHYYSICHLTRYIYSATVTASMMELRMEPRSDGDQRSVEFRLTLSPKAKYIHYQDHLKNKIHVFDIPGEHKKLAIRADSIVEVRSIPSIPDTLPGSAWKLLQQGQFYQETQLLILCVVLSQRIRTQSYEIQ